MFQPGGLGGVFLTRSVERAYHILALAADAMPNKPRRLVYAATLENSVPDNNPLRAPIFLDHPGAAIRVSWHSAD